VGLRVAYLTTEYPKVSHTFIRREIQALEELGHFVLRLSIRRGDAVHAVDRAEASRTVVCLDLPVVRIVLATLMTAFGRPLAMLRGLAMAMRMSRASDRGLFRHLAYVCEAATLLRCCERHDVAHVHVHFGTNAAAVARLMRCLSRRRLSYSMTIHGPDEFDAPRGFALREKVADAAFVAVISDFCHAQVKRWSDPEHWSKLHVVRCTVDQSFTPIGPIPASSRTLLCVGRLAAQKGHLLLLEALAQLRDNGADADLILAGDGELRFSIEQTIRALGLEPRVRITGWFDEPQLRQLLARARVVVLPSFAEGLPVVIMEAFATQRPVIAPWVAGVPELVRPGENGWLVPAGSVAELAAAMASALETPASRLDSMGRFGARLVRERHDAATEVRKLESLLAAASRAVAGPGRR
jgi:colanic acid/amylovoran biosynthesis glycosyltransferase